MREKCFNFLVLILILFTSAVFFTIVIQTSDAPLQNQTSEESADMESLQFPLTSAWIANGTAICTETNNQWNIIICTDDAGGAIIAWEDDRTGYHNRSVYVQKINSKGVIQWNSFPDGVPIYTNTSMGFFKGPSPQICSDGAGGAIITWMDNRTGTGMGDWDLYAQRINSAGTLEWADQGVPICTVNSYVDYPRIISLTGGGALITWHDSRSGNLDIFAQKIDSDGNRIWTVNGKPVCTQTYNQDLEHGDMCSDGAGGAIIVWSDDRGGSDNRTVYAQRINSTGDIEWTLEGEPICTITNNQFFNPSPKIISDDENGAIIAWRDNRTGQTGGLCEIYAQKVDTNGDPVWTVQGEAICNGPWDMDQIDGICGDGANGAIIAWNNITLSGRNVHAQKINSLGIVQWGTNGKVISNATGDQWSSSICIDGSGGAIITWRDNRVDNDIYAQHIDSQGKMKWTANGSIICNADYDQRYPQIVYTGSGTAIIAWLDERSGNNDVYAYRVGKGVQIIPSGGGNGDDSVKSEVFDPTMIMVIGLIVVAGAISLVTGRTYVARKGGIRKDTGKIKDYIKQREEVVEDDIILSKEKHFCLVHKGPIEGYNFICPTCNAYYCIRCVEAIKELENACWSCGKPLDPSQPIKSLEEEYDITPITEKESKLDATKGKSDNKKIKPKS